MQDYTYYIFKDGEFHKYNYDEIKKIINKDSYFIKVINSYMAPVYLYKKQKDIKWKVILKFEEFIDFIIKNENKVILYTFQPKNIEHITKAIIERKEVVKQEEQNTIKEYIAKETYDTNNLFVATISYNYQNNIVTKKFILELDKNIYREIFSGFIINNETTNNYQFNIIETEPLNTYIDKKEVTRIELLLLLQNKINSNNKRKRYIKKNPLT